MLDDERSFLTIDATSSIHPIHTTTRVAGWVDLDAGGRPVLAPDEPPPPGGVIGQVAFDVTAMRSGNPLIDREAERRLRPTEYPTVLGELTALVGRHDGTVLAADTDGPAYVYDGAGRLTFHGVTRDITGELSIAKTDDELRLTGTTRIDVTDFVVQPPSLLMVKVHKDVTITIDAVAHR